MSTPTNAGSAPARSASAFGPGSGANARRRLTMPLVLFENWDEVTQRFTQIVEDVETGLPIITYTQNTKPILDQNKRDAANFKGTNPDGFTRVACIPNVVVQRLMQTGIWFDQ